MNSWRGLKVLALTAIRGSSYSEAPVYRRTTIANLERR
jgi:hypothetical protein